MSTKITIDPYTVDHKRRVERLASAHISSLFSPWELDNERTLDPSTWVHTLTLGQLMAIIACEDLRDACHLFSEWDFYPPEFWEPLGHIAQLDQLLQTPRDYDTGAASVSDTDIWSITADHLIHLTRSWKLPTEPIYHQRAYDIVYKFSIGQLVTLCQTTDIRDAHYLITAWKRDRYFWYPAGLQLHYHRLERVASEIDYRFGDPIPVSDPRPACDDLGGGDRG